MGVAGITISGLSRQPTIQMVTVADQESPAVGGALVDAVVVRVLSEETSSLDADFLAALLRHRTHAEQHRQRAQQNECAKQISFDWMKHF